MLNTLRCHALLHIQFFKHQTDTFNTLSFLHEVVTIEHCYRFPPLCRDDRFSHPATHRLLTEDATLRFHDKVEHSVAFYYSSAIRACWNCISTFVPLLIAGSRQPVQQPSTDGHPMANEVHSISSYAPLDTAKQEIRLLVLKKAEKEDSAIHCSLEKST